MRNTSSIRVCQRIRHIQFGRTHRDWLIVGKWWLYAETTTRYAHVLCTAKPIHRYATVAKHRLFVWVDRTVLCNQQTVVFARADDYFLACFIPGRMSSGLEQLERNFAKLRAAFATLRLPPSRPSPSPGRPGRNPRTIRASRPSPKPPATWCEQRDAWLNPPGVSEAELKKRTLTNLYNQRPDLAGSGAQEAGRGGARCLRLAARPERRGDPGAAAGAEFGTGGEAVRSAILHEESCPR